MTNKQFKEIRDMAWDWWCKNMLDWAVNTINDFDNATEWVKNGVDNSLEPDNLQKLLRLSQSRNFDVNYTKELLEFLQAKRDHNEYKMIDALCDMVIVSINAGAVLGNDCSEMLYSNITNPLRYRPTYVRGLLFEIRKRGYDPYKCLVETIKELNTRTGAWNEQEGKWCKDLGAYTEQEAYEIAKEKGIFYNFGLEYDKKTKEPYWVSDTNHSADWKKLKIKKWYKADYENCKIAVCPYCKNNCGYGKYVECQNCGMKFQTIAD